MEFPSHTQSRIFIYFKEITKFQKAPKDIFPREGGGRGLELKVGVRNPTDTITNVFVTATGVEVRNHSEVRTWHDKNIQTNDFV